VEHGAHFLILHYPPRAQEATVAAHAATMVQHAVAAEILRSQLEAQRQSVERISSHQAAAAAELGRTASSLAAVRLTADAAEAAATRVRPTAAYSRLQSICGSCELWGFSGGR
jgi:hypothetical protein